MQMLAAGDTWGIPGPIFLACYVLTAVALVAWALLARRPKAPAGSPDLNTYEIAYLAGGRTRAVVAALGTLRAKEVIEPAGLRRLKLVDGTSPPTAGTGLERALYDTLRWKGALTATELIRQGRVQDELNALRRRLQRMGLLHDEGRRALMRGPLWLLGVLAAVGVIRLFSGVGDAKAIGGLVTALLVTVVAIVALALSIPQVSPAGRRAVAQSRQHGAHLDPAVSPSWGTYGESAVALGVALYGTDALASFDPAFAQKTHMEGELGAGGVYSGCGGGGGDDGGGGGGCGGGCGGCGG